MPVKVRSSFQRKVDHICRVIFLTEEGKRALDAAGIEIPFPQMDVHLR